jgi:hypothetical protein
LQDLPLRSGKWWHSDTFTAMLVMLELGIKPSEWREMDPDDRAWLAAAVIARNMMQAWEQQELERELEQQRRRTRKGG